jgi:hypothetical protein
VRDGELKELFVDPWSAKFWKREGEKYSYLYWVRAMVSTRKEKAPFNKIENLSLTIEEKALFYKRLGEGFFEPNEELVKSLIEGSFIPLKIPLPPSISNPLCSFKGKNPTKLLDLLLREYTRIFLDSYMPFIPPYESIYQGSRRVMGEPADEVVKWYERFGLSAEGEMPDHISHEFEFVGILYEKGETKAAAEFLKEHLLLWGTKLCEDLKALSKEEFYHSIASLGKWILSLEAKDVS